MPYPQTPFELISMDFVGPLVTTIRGNKHVLVVIDHLTRWADAFAVPNQTASMVARTLVENYFKYHGPPEMILSDQGANFMSNLLKQLYRLLKVTRLRTTAYKPSTNGKVERLNGVLIKSLAKECEKHLTE